MLKNFSVETKQRNDFINITDSVQKCVKQSNIKSGVSIIFIPHTTAGVTINENADPAVRSDIISHLKNVVPDNPSFSHSEGNSDAHIKASLVGFSQTVIIEEEKLVLGTWQGIFFCEFDGPRTRKVYVKIISD